MLKKLSILLALVLSLSIIMVGCQKKDAVQQPSGGDTTQTEGDKKPQETPPPVTPENEGDKKPDAGKPTDGDKKPETKPDTKPTPKPDTKPTPKPDQKPTPKPEPKPDPKPTPKPETKPVVKVSSIWSKVKGSQSGLSKMMDFDMDMASDLYGISASNLEEVGGGMATVNVKAQEFFIAKVKDGKMNSVVASLNERAEALKKQWEHYLQDQYEIVKNYKIVKNGNYVMFVVSADAGAAVNAFNSSF